MNQRESFLASDSRKAVTEANISREYSNTLQRPGYCTNHTSAPKDEADFWVGDTFLAVVNRF